MLFIWDPLKAASNLKKHGVSFELAETVFDDPHQLSVPDPRHDHEERWVTIGKSADAKTLVVVHLYREIKDGGEQIRIISARRATRKETRDYEERI